MSITIGATGFALSLSLILAIGAQNAFVLRQGLRREHVFLVCSICAVSDAVLILFGVFVVGDTVAQTAFDGLLRAFAVLFLVGYAGLRFRSSLIGTNGLSMEAGSDPSSMGRTIALTLGFTWLNPHVYLDTVLLIGGGAVGLDGTDRIFFAGGAMAASFAFFFALGYGARIVSSFVAQPAAWRVIDFGIGVTMLLIAIGVWMG